MRSGGALPNTRSPFLGCRENHMSTPIGCRGLKHISDVRTSDLGAFQPALAIIFHEESKFAVQNVRF